MSNQKKNISGIKEFRNRRFIGNISLLLDEIRLKAIKLAPNNDTFEYFKYNTAMNIKNDDKKLEAIEVLGIEDYEKIDILNTLKSDDKKLEVLKWFDDEWMRLKVAKTINDDNKKKIAIDSFKNEEIIGELALSIKKLEKVGNVKGLSDLIKIAKSHNNDKDLFEKIEEQLVQLEKVKSIKDDNEKVEAINSVESEYLKAEVAKTINDDNKKMKIIETINNDWSKAIVAATIADDNKKVIIINNLNDNKSILKIARTIKDDDNKMKVLDNVKNDHLKLSIARTIKDDNKKIEIITSSENGYFKRKLVETIEDDNKIIEALSLLTTDKDKIRVLEEVKDEDKKIDYLIENFNYEYIQNFYEEFKRKDNPKLKDVEVLLKNIGKTKKSKNDDKKEEFIDSINNEKLKIEIIATINDDNKKEKVLEKLSPEQWRKYRNLSGDIDFIKSKIEKFIEIEGFKGNVAEGIIEELYEKNNSVVLNIDFRFLDEKYIDLLGKNKINLISCYQEVQEKILSLDDKQIYVFSKCIDNYIETMQTDEWTVLGQELLENISNGEYDGLFQSIQKVEDLSQEDFRDLTQILQSSNWCDITEIKQVKNFEKIR